MSDKLEAARSRLRAAVQERYDAGVAYDEAVRELPRHEAEETRRRDEEAFSQRLRSLHRTV